MMTNLANLIKVYQELVKAPGIGKLQKLNRKRQLKDLKSPPKGYTFDEEKALRVISFLEKLPHVKGELAGQKFKPEEWQKYDIVYPLFGWVDSAGNRRFKIAYLEMARKSGKSFLLSGIGLYMAFFDGEAGAEVYAIATKKDQAKIVFDMANGMKNATTLRKRIKTAYFKMTSKGNSVFAPLGADSKTLDGLSTHFCIVDEYHSHRNSDLYDVIKSSTGARKNSLMAIITTAGFNKASACYAEREYSEKILSGALINENHFVFIASIDKGDDPFNPLIWGKANPNLGVSNSLEDFRVAANEAKQKGGQTLTEFLTKRLNVWTNSSSVWVKDEDFELPKETLFDENELLGRTCYGGLDLSKTGDLSAYALTFPETDGTYKTIVRSYVPEKAYEERERGDNVYRAFKDNGTLTITPGNTIDYRMIFNDIVKDAQDFELVEMAYDRFLSAQIVTDLTAEGIDLIPFGQGFVSMSPPTAEIERLLLDKKLHHNNDPLLRWQLSNVIIEYDSAGNMKMSKKLSQAGSGGNTTTAKIDAWISIAMSLARTQLYSVSENETDFLDFF